MLKGIADLTRVARLVGPGSVSATDRTWGLHGADLGHLFDLDGRLYMVFGDSFGPGGPPGGGAGGSDWRCNTMAVIAGRSAAEGLPFDRMIVDRPGHAKQLLPDRQKGRSEVTVIPTAGVGLGRRMYLHYMSVRRWGTPGRWTLNHAGLAYSDDRGHTWAMDPAARWPGESNFGQVAFVRRDADLYLFGIPGGRFGGVKLARAPETQILERTSYRYFSGLAAGQPQWSEQETDGLIMVPAPVGELSVVWNDFLGRWTMTYLDEGARAIVMREAPELWGPWSAPVILAPLSAYPQAYGAYMHPWLLEEGGGEIVYFTMSQWGPYSVFLMRARLTR